VYAQYIMMYSWYALIFGNDARNHQRASEEALVKAKALHKSENSITTYCQYTERSVDAPSHINPQQTVGQLANATPR
jgi:hypothetical protein